MGLSKTLHYPFRSTKLVQKERATKPETTDDRLLTTDSCPHEKLFAANPNYDIYRIVEVLWAIDFDNPPVSAKADAMFDYREVLNYQGGKVMELEKLPTFRQRWDDDGGLGGFQTYIRNLLGLSSND